MNAELLLSNARVRDVNDFDVKLGEDFELVLDSGGEVDWFANNDEVLEIAWSENPLRRKIKAKAIGSCTIQIQQNTSIQKIMKVHVFGDIAVDLGLSSSEPEVKP